MLCKPPGLMKVATCKAPTCVVAAAGPVGYAPAVVRLRVRRKGRPMESFIPEPIQSYADRFTTPEPELEPQGVRSKT